MCCVDNWQAGLVRGVRACRLTQKKTLYLYVCRFKFYVILYKVERYVCMLFIDDKDSVKLCFSICTDLRLM